MLAKTGDPRQLQERVIGFVTAHSDNAQMLLGTLQLLEKAGNRTATVALRQRLGLPDDAATAAQVARFLDDSRLGTALLAAFDLDGRASGAVQLLNQVALSLQNAGRAGEADPLYQKAIEADGNNVPILYNYARIKVQLGELETAIELLERALRRRPDFRAAAQLLDAVRARATGNAA